MSAAISSLGAVGLLLANNDWNGHMDNWGPGWWVAMGVMMIVFWGLVVAGIVWLVRSLPHARHREPTARELLRATSGARGDLSRGVRGAAEGAGRRRGRDDSFLAGRAMWLAGTGPGLCASALRGPRPLAQPREPDMAHPGRHDAG